MSYVCMLEIACERCVAALRRGKQVCIYIYIVYNIDSIYVFMLEIAYEKCVAALGRGKQVGKCIYS